MQCVTANRPECHFILFFCLFNAGTYLQALLALLLVAFLAVGSQLTASSANNDPPVVMGVFKVYCSRYTLYTLYVIYNGHLLVINKTDYV